MLKKSASGVLAALRGSTYRSVRLASSLAAALLDGLFEHPARSLSDIDRSTAANDPRPYCVVLGPKKSSMYSSEYTSGFSRPAALHLAAPPSPRYEGNVRQAPGRTEWIIEGLAGCSKSPPAFRKVKFQAKAETKQVESSLNLNLGLNLSLLRSQRPPH